MFHSGNKATRRAEKVPQSSEPVSQLCRSFVQNGAFGAMRNSHGATREKDAGLRRPSTAPQQILESAQPKKPPDALGAPKQTRPRLLLKTPLDVYFPAQPHVLMEAINSRYGVFLGVGGGLARG